MNQVKNFFKENKLLIISYVLSLLFFIYQHYKILNWDFTVYILNAKYLINQGNYFEWARYPLPSILIIIFSIFSWKLAPYVFIILVSLLHLYSSIKIAEKFNFDKTIYYLISLSPFLLLEGLKNGTELLSLSLIQLFLVYFNTNYSAVFFGLAFLTRYTAIGLLPLILFLKKPKKIIVFLLIFLVVISPWLIFNYIKTGNAFLSLVDSYALNIRFRDYINESFPLKDFLINFNYLLIFFFMGFYKKIKKLDKNDFMMLLILLLTLISFIKTPIKSFTLRYLFLILIPLSYFSVIALNKIKKQITFLMFLIILLTSFYFTYTYNKDKLENYQEALPYLDNCSTYSNNWVYLNYLGKNTKPDPYKGLIEEKINNGSRILIYYSNIESFYMKNETFVKNLPIITKNELFIVFGNKSKCNPEQKKIDNPYIIELRDVILENYNYTEDISNCNIFFKKKIALIC